MDKQNDTLGALAAYKEAVERLKTVMERVDTEGEKRRDRDKAEEEGRTLKGIVSYFDATPTTHLDFSNSSHNDILSSTVLESSSPRPSQSLSPVQSKSHLVFHRISIPSPDSLTPLLHDDFYFSALSSTTPLFGTSLTLTDLLRKVWLLESCTELTNSTMLM
jgi:hypothetical protein